MNQAAQRGCAHAEAQARDEARSCLASQGERYRAYDLLSTDRAACIREQQVRQALGEHAAATVADGTPKASDT